MNPILNIHLLKIQTNTNILDAFSYTVFGVFSSSLLGSESATSEQTPARRRLDSESTRCRKWIRHPVCFWVELLFCFNWAKGQSCSNTMCSVDLEKINSGCGTHDDINWLFIWQLPNCLFSTDVVFSVFLYFCDYTHGRGSFTLLLLRISKSEMSGMRTFSSPHTLFYFILFF